MHNKRFVLYLLCLNKIKRNQSKGLAKIQSISRNFFQPCPMGKLISSPYKAYFMPCLVTLFVRKGSSFQNSPKWTIFWWNFAHSNINAARFARKVECDFLSNFQTLSGTIRKEPRKCKKCVICNICEYVNWLFLLGRIHNAVMSVNRNRDQCHAR